MQTRRSLGMAVVKYQKRYPVTTDPYIRTKTADGLVERLLAGLVREDRACLAEAITMIESTSLIKQRTAQQILTAVLNMEKERVAKRGKAALCFRVGNCSVH